MEQTKKTRKRVARWLIPLFILLAIISYPLLFGKIGLHARYKIENDAVVISSVIVNPTFKMYGWSFPSICDPNKDPDIMVNGKRYYIIIDPMGHRFMCAQAYTTIHTTIVEPVPLNDISIPFSDLKDGENDIEISYGEEDDIIKNYKTEGQDSMIRTTKVTTKLKVNIDK